MLLAVLLYKTQWPSLRAGVGVLLIGQVIDVIALTLRTVRPSRSVEMREHWFQEEENFTWRLGRMDAIVQFIGFAALGYACWQYTGSRILGIAIGVLYPLTFYFGLHRKRTDAAIRELQRSSAECLGRSQKIAER